MSAFTIRVVCGIVRVIARAVCVPLVTATAMAAEAPLTMGTVTILDGNAFVTRGLSRLQAAEGVRLEAGDLIDTGGTGFMQIELPDRTALQLGPNARAMVQTGGDRQKPTRSIHMLSGWLKHSSHQRDAKAGPGLDIRSPLIEIPSQPGVLVIDFGSSSVSIFAEAGESKILERQDKGNPVSVGLKPGDLYVRKAGSKGVIDAGAKTAFVKTMPPVFRDSLPARADKFDKAIPAKPAPAFAYADVEAWLKSEPALRRQFVQRWRAKVNEAPFRAALIANLTAHPEWDPVLFPEKYLPKPAPEPARTTPASIPSVPAATSLPAPAQDAVTTRSAAPAQREALPAPVQALPPPAQ